MTQTDRHIDHKETPMTDSLDQGHLRAAGTTGWTLNKTLLALGGILNRVLIALAFGWVTITAGRLIRNAGTRAR